MPHALGLLLAAGAAVSVGSDAHLGAARRLQGGTATPPPAPPAPPPSAGVGGACVDDPGFQTATGASCAVSVARAARLALPVGQPLGLSCASTIGEIFPSLFASTSTAHPTFDASTQLSAECCASCQAVATVLPGSKVVCTGEMLREKVECCGDATCSARETEASCALDCAPSQQLPGWAQDWVDEDGGEEGEADSPASAGADGRWQPPPAPETTKIYYMSVLLLILPLSIYAAWARSKYSALHRTVGAWLASRGDRVAHPMQLTPRAAGGLEAARASPSNGGRGAFQNAEAIENVARGQAQLKLSVAHLNYWVHLPRSLAEQLRRTPPRRKQLLTDICANFTPGRLTAILGATGAGKTTLLNLVSHRAKMGEFSGLRMLNGVPTENATYQKVMRQQGYVTQTCENFFEDLTIHDTMLYAAMLGLSEAMSLEAKLTRIEKCLAELGLSDVATERMDQVTFRTKKRVSIAVELLRQPALLMLDEPTTGLDATASLKLVQTLHTLARTGNRTVVCVIHQPRSDIFSFVDEVLLLAKGGRMVYAGTTDGAVEAIKVGIPDLDVTQYKNPGDFIIDAIGLDPESDEPQTQGDKEQSSSHLAELYKRSQAYRDSVNVIARDLRASGAATAPVEMPGAGDFATSVFTQLWVLFARRTRRTMVHPTWILFSGVQSVGVVLVMSLCFSYYPPDPDAEAACRPDDPPHCTADLPYRNLMFLFMTSYYAFLMQYLLNVPLYFEERQVLIRERLGGVVRYAAYIFSGFLCEGPAALFNGVTQVVASQALMPLNNTGSYPVFSAIFLTVSICAWQGNVALCSCMTDDIAQTYSFLFMIVGTGLLFGGFSVAYSYIPWYFKALGLYYVSLPAVAFRAYIVNDFVGDYLHTPCDLVLGHTSNYMLFVSPADLEQNIINYTQSFELMMLSYSTLPVSTFAEADLAGVPPEMRGAFEDAQHWMQSQPGYHKLTLGQIGTVAAANASDGVVNTLPNGSSTVDISMDPGSVLANSACSVLAQGDPAGTQVPLNLGVMWLKDLEFDRVDPYDTLTGILVLAYVFRVLALGMLLLREQLTMKLSDITIYEELFAQFGLSEEAASANVNKMTPTKRLSRQNLDDLKRSFSRESLSTEAWVSSAEPSTL